MIHKLFTFPLKTLYKLAETITEELETELYDLERIKSDLLKLHMEFERRGITESEYLQQEERLMERYKIARERAQISDDG